MGDAEGAFRAKGARLLSGGGANGLGRGKALLGLGVEEAAGWPTAKASGLGGTTATTGILLATAGLVTVTAATAVLGAETTGNAADAAVLSSPFTPARRSHSAPANAESASPPPSQSSGRWALGF